MVLKFFKVPVAEYREEVKLENNQKNFLKRSFNILLLGYGGEGHEGGTLSDAMLIINLDSRKKVNIISIPRDIWVDIPIRSDISQKFKINHAYAIGLNDPLYPLKEPQYKGEFGGGNLAKKVVEDVTGLSIDYFIAVDFSGFKEIIDILGGIEVDVPVTFDDYFYPIKGKENDTCGKSQGEILRIQSLYSDTELHHQFECRYEHIHFEKGLTRMDGETALKFVRSRSSQQHGGDFARGERQKAVLLGIKDKLLSLGVIEKLDEMFGVLVKMVKTDLDLKAVKDLYEILGNPGEYKINYISINTSNVLVSTKSLDGQFILISKEGEGIWLGVQNYIRERMEN